MTTIAKKLLLISTFLAITSVPTLANAEVLYLKCPVSHYKGPNPGYYATVDFGRSVAKFSDQPADDRAWNRAEITDTTIRWEQQYTGGGNATIVFNRYTGLLIHYSRGGPRGVTFHDCSRTAPPRRAY